MLASSGDARTAKDAATGAAAAHMAAQQAPSLFPTSETDTCETAAAELPMSEPDKVAAGGKAQNGTAAASPARTLASSLPRRTRKPSERVRSGAIDGDEWDEIDAEPAPKLRKRTSRRSSSTPTMAAADGPVEAGTSAASAAAAASALAVGSMAGSAAGDDILSPRSIAPRSAMRPLVSAGRSRSADAGLLSPGTPQSGAKHHRVLPAFLTKLYDIVESKESDEIIRWSPSGDSFVIVNETALSKDFLPRYFKHSNFSSFVRQLNMYGFRKLKCILGHDWEYGHNSFRRGRADLLSEIKRRYTGSAPTTNPARLGSAASAAASAAAADAGPDAAAVSAAGTPLGVIVSPMVSAQPAPGSGRKRGRASSGQTRPAPAILAAEDLREIHERFEAICTDMGDLIRMHRKTLMAGEQTSETDASRQELNQFRTRLHASEQAVFSILRPVLDSVGRASAASSAEKGAKTPPSRVAAAVSALETVATAPDVKREPGLVTLAPETAGGPPRKESKVEDHALLMLNLSVGHLPDEP